MEYWQSMEMRLRYGDDTWVPGGRILPPGPGDDLTALDGNGRRLLLALHLLKGIALPDGMESLPLVARCRRVTQWQEIPLAVAGMQGKARLVPVLLGLLPEPDTEVEPGWLSPQAEQAAREALRQGGSGCGFMLLPRVDPASLPRRIDGPSLALPLAVAARRMVAGRSFPSDVVLTGALDDRGGVRSVACLQEKLDCALQKKYPARLFLFPHADREMLTAPQSIPVACLDDADALLDLENGNAADIAARLSSWQKKPAEFFDWIAIADPNFRQQALPPLLRLAGQRRWFADLDDDALSQSLKSLDRIWAMLKDDTSAIEAVLSLIPCDRVAGLPTSTELLHLAEKHKTQGNHRGESIRQWCDISNRCLNELRQTPSHALRLEELNSRVRDMVGILHNAYRFIPSDIPLEWEEQLQKLAAIGPDPAIGKSYGFLTHHMAFCNRLEDARHHAKLSLCNFCAPKDKQRRYADLVFIHLDAGDPDGARQWLCKLLEVPPATASLAEAAARQTDPFSHAAFVRFCRQCPDTLRDYPVETILAQAESERKHPHPWQLWANNCGRLLVRSNPALARRCLCLSRDICLERASSYALPPMALLPLAALHAAQLESAQDVLRQTESVLQRLREDCALSLLHEPHFRPLLALADPAAVLDAVNADPARYFPFNYR